MILLEHFWKAMALFSEITEFIGFFRNACILYFQLANFINQEVYIKNLPLSHLFFYIV